MLIAHHTPQRRANVRAYQNKTIKCNKNNSNNKTKALNLIKWNMRSILMCDMKSLADTEYLNQIKNTNRILNAAITNGKTEKCITFE